MRSLSRWFVPFRSERVLSEDADLLVVDKPQGLAVHGGDPELADDLVTRLGLYLSAKGDDAYLAVHQRLDKAASGALFFCRNPRLNAPLARDFAEGGVRRSYLAQVELSSGARLSESGRFEDRLEFDGERARVVPAGGREAVTHYRVLTRSGSRAVFELELETGRPHQLRVQLAARGAPIVGDRLYGGAPAFRLMLHAARLELASFGKSFACSAPPEVVDLEHGVATAEACELDPALLFERLADAGCLRYPLADRCEAFRAVNGEADGLSGVVVDRYADWVVLAVSTKAAEAQVAGLSASLERLGARGVYLKKRARADLRRIDLAELRAAAPLVGEPAPEALVVREHERRFCVRLGEGLETGLFVDQRENRTRLGELVRKSLERSKRARVLNLFSYTASFSVVAALAGATSVVSVDLSAKALARAADNFEKNGLDPRRFRFERADVAVWLKGAKRRRERFELVVLDPPSFATVDKKRTFRVKDDYLPVAAQVLELLSPGGQLLAVTNHRKTSRERLRRILHGAARLARRRITQMKDLASGLDCPDGPEGPTPSKSVLVTVE